eukprot:EG_transcript_56323
MSFVVYPPFTLSSSCMLHLGQLPTVSNDDGCRCLPRLRAITFNLLHHVKAIDHRTKDNVLSIKPLRLCSAQEELRSIGAWSGVGHGKYTRSGVLEREVLVSKLFTIDRFATST